MKKFFKKYAMTLVALGIAGGTLMSFELNKSAVLVDNWHEVVNGSSLIPNGQASPPNDCPEEGEEYCALQISLKSGVTIFPATVADAESMEAAGQLTIDDRRYKE